MEFTIYSIGDSLFLEQILIALAMIAGVPDFEDMIKIGLLLGVFSAVLSAIAKGGREIEFQHVLLGYIIYATMFIPTTRVLIEDTYTGSVRVVDNVPMGAAAAGGIISLVGYKVTELFELAYGPIVPKITETQFAESLSILNDMRQKAATDPATWQGVNVDNGGGSVDIRRSYSNYIKDCTLKKIDLGVMNADELYKGNYAVSLQFDSHLFTTRTYLLPGNSAGQSRTCNEAWSDLQALSFAGTELSDALVASLGFDGNQLAVGETMQSKITTASDALLNSAITANTYIRIGMLEPILEQAAAGKYSDLNDISGATMINQAIQQRNTEWAAEQTLFMTIVRPMLAFFEAFIYAVAPIMAFVIVLGAKGIQLAGKYFTMLIWIQLWMPLLAIVNLYIHTAAKAKFDTYSSVATHNWESFYALGTTSDIAQHWVATGGLLAASTPAIALMLIYGSAVTATHLAGRLKGADHINEKIQSPDAVSSQPMHQIASQYAGNMTSGVIQSGAESSIGTASIGATFSNSTQSSQGVMQTESDQFTGALAQSIRSDQSADAVHSKMSSMGAMVSSGQSQTAQFASDHAKKFVQQHSAARGHEEAFTGAAAMSAHMGANLDVDKVAGAMAEKTGVGRAAIKSFLQEAGVMKQPGTGMVPVNDSEKSNMLNVDAGARVSGTSTSTTSDRTGETSTNNSSNASGYRFDEGERQAFNKELSSKIDSQSGESFKKSWGSSDSSEVRKASSELVSADRSYRQSQSLMNTMGSLSSMKMHEVGALAAGRNQGDFSGDKSAETMMDNAWSQQPEAVKQHANDLQNRYQKFGMSADVAKNTSRLTALTDQNNFKGDNVAQARATQLAARVIQQATGHGGENIDYNASQHSKINGPETQPNDIRDQASNLNGPDMSGQKTVKQNALKPNSSVAADQSQLNENVVRSNADTNKENIINNAGDAESQASASAISKAESGVVNNATKMGLGVEAVSALTNGSDWASRRIDQIGGGTGAFLNEASSKMGDAFESYKNMTPEQQQQYQKGLKEQDATLFDQLGAAGLPVKGAQMLGNQIIGAAVSGYEALRGNENFSEATKDMSWQEKGAFWAAASGEAANQGVTSMQQFMTDHGAQFKSDMQEYGMQAYNLMPEQAAVYAESYDTNSAAMRTAVNNLEKPYAVQDEQGHPQWDDANNRWELSPEKRAFTNAMVNSLTESSDAGSHAGSYLGSIQAYNVAKQRVTPNN